MACVTARFTELIREICEPRRVRRAQPARGRRPRRYGLTPDLGVEPLPAPQGMLSEQCRECGTFVLCLHDPHDLWLALAVRRDWLDVPEAGRPMQIYDQRGVIVANLDPQLTRPRRAAVVRSDLEAALGVDKPGQPFGISGVQRLST